MLGRPLNSAEAIPNELVLLTLFGVHVQSKRIKSFGKQMAAQMDKQQANQQTRAFDVPLSEVI